MIGPVEVVAATAVAVYVFAAVQLVRELVGLVVDVHRGRLADIRAARLQQLRRR